MNMPQHGRTTTFAFAALGLTFWLSGALAAQENQARPNVILVMTDDQGYGDLGAHGNPKIKTPNLDRFARQSVEFSQFYVCPVCSPTRSSLLTGRYNYRTGVVDTFVGRSLMFADEVTLAEMLGAAGYRTGIFGKWHLGDNYPLRAMDQGFQEALVIKGGGIRQPSDPPGGDGYFNPMLMHNGRLEQSRGYCSDVYTDAAIQFIEQPSDRPFFVYLPFNAPHGPFEAPEKELAAYRKENLDPDEFPKIGYPQRGRVGQDDLARAYAMVTNIDENFGRLMNKLDELQLAKNTIVIFLTDNGPPQPRYNAGLHGLKGSVYEGGIRVLFYIRWPARLPAGQKREIAAAHIDVAPTLLEACHVEPPAGLKFDGHSLLHVLLGKAGDSPERTLFFQWHRGNRPQLHRAFAARGPRWKLLQANGAFDESQKPPESPRFELYDLPADPYEEHDVAAEHPEIVADLKRQYEAWFSEMSAARDFALPRIAIGTEHENPVVLTRQDWRGSAAGWKPNDIGHWELDVATEGEYQVILHFTPGADSAEAALGGQNHERHLKPGEDACELGPFRLKPGPERLDSRVAEGDIRRGVLYAEVRRVGN
ncbi:MAG TPA: arylsulfatase [Pirellulales bacterium]|nr:arylsulfatase [Pirellulales bacterium]